MGFAFVVDQLKGMWTVASESKKIVEQTLIETLTWSSYPFMKR